MVDLIFTFCEIMIVISYLFQNVLILRIVTIIGMSGHVLGALMAGYDTQGMKAIIFFSIINVAINLIQSVRLIISKIPVLLPADLKSIYKNNFYMMTTNEFMHLANFSTKKTYQKNEIITTQDEPVPELILITKGLVKIIKNGTTVTTLGPGFFIGEMSFLTGSFASATVMVETDEVESIQWEKNKLPKIELYDDELCGKFKQAIAVNLIEKIENASI
jgi:hypothetical protein